MDTRKRARENEIEMLRALASVGWLTPRLAGGWVWPLSTWHSSTNNAKSVLTRLEKRGFVLRRTVDHTGAQAWVLTRAGADAMNDALETEDVHTRWVHHGYDLSTKQVARHVALVEFLIEKRRAGFGALGRTGLRAIRPEYRNFDGAFFDSDYTVTGVLVVGTASRKYCDWLRELRRNYRVQLIGDLRVVRTIESRLGQC